MIARPGLDMDETIFVNAATLRLPGVYITHSLHGIPLMIFPYIGALKSWLYDPIFAIFGTSTTKIRLPAILITSAGLLILFVGVRDLVNRTVAGLTFVALCFDNSVFWLTRDDVGPSAIQLFLGCAAVFCVARLASTRRMSWVVVLLVVLGLGVFNKLNFIWVVNAAAVVSVVVLARHRTVVRGHWRSVATWVIGLAVIYGCFGLYYITNHIGSIGASSIHGSLLSHTWPSFSRGTAAILSGTWFYDYALRPLAPNDLVVWIVLLLFTTGLIASVSFRSTRSLPVAGLGLATILIALQNLLTLQATAGWHYISIYPFVTVVTSYGAYVSVRLLVGRNRRTVGALALIAVAAVAYDGVLMARYFRALHGEPRFSAWSPAIYRLSNELKYSHATIFTADWGIFNPLFALQPGRRYQELAYALENTAASELHAVAVALSTTPGPKLVVTHANAKLIFSQSKDNLLEAVGGHLRLMSTIDGLDRRPVYDLYSYN
jgi:4-amino-4-deoxy-L-arabinose transferase-like glycosyltransferase